MACAGYTLSGQKCRRRVAQGQRYCSVHSRESEIGFPPYVSVSPSESFWVYLPIDCPTWKVGVKNNQLLRCPAKPGVEYTIEKYVNEGTYGVVYFATRGLPAVAQNVAIKVCKFIYRSSRKTDLDDFLKEYYMHVAVRDRVKSECVVKLLDAFFIKTRQGLHGAIVMERMDGNVSDLFNKLESVEHIEVLRLWVFTCNFIASALLQLHGSNIFHLDIKAGNVLFRRTRGQGRGIVLRLVDLGLGCYIGGHPKIECAATGTYLPKEWRKNGDKSKPTFEIINDPKVLQRGEAYAMCVTCVKLFKHVKCAAAKSPFIKPFVQMLVTGKDESLRVRSAVTIKMVQQASADLLKDMDAALPDMDETLHIITKKR